MTFKKLLAPILLALLVVPSFVAAANCTSLTSGLVSYWSFNSSNSNDQVGSNNGTDNSITYSTGNGKIGVGAGFGGSSWISLSGSGTLDITGTVTVAAWAKTSSSGGPKAILSHSQDFTSTNTTNQYTLMQTGGGNVNFVISSGSSENDAVGSTTINDNSFHFLVGEYSPSSFDRTYVDGKEDGNTTTSIFGSLNSISTGVAIGSSNTQTAEYNGAIDEVGVWNCTLTGAQITTLYNAGAGETYPFATAVATFAPWQFWDF